MSPFQAPHRSLAGLDVETTSTLIAAASDVALFVDGAGVIRDVAIGSEDVLEASFRGWIGQPWTAIVTVESQPKVQALLKDASSRRPVRWRHVNHPSAEGADVPIMYSAVRVGDGEGGGVVAIGRDMRSSAALQQRLLDAQQSMERDYARLRHLETRYRLLLRCVDEAVLIAEVATQRIVEANPAAAALLGEATDRVVGSSLEDWFRPDSREPLQTLLGAVRAGGRTEELAAQLIGEPSDVRLSTSLFRQENGAHFLVRLLPGQPGPSVAPGGLHSRTSSADLARVVDRVPDGFVVTDNDGRILVANAAFVDLVQLAVGEQVQGERLDRWLGRTAVDMNVLISNLRQHGSVRLFATTLRGQYGATTPVEISAAAVPDEHLPCLGFTIRDVGRRLRSDTRQARELPRNVGQLTELVGRAPLKQIVGETTDLIEQLCIEAALELTGDNRASAAEMLGLSRQSLYVKLRRYGLGDLGGDGADDK